MKNSFIKAREQGVVVKIQTFETDKGVFRIELIRLNNDIYFFKYLNGNIVECSNLTKSKGGRYK